MPWFKVDDTFHSHPKVLAAPPAALGLWVVAGSWSGSNLSDGFVPDHVLPRLLPDAVTLAQQLVTAGLWKRARGGYRFHDWNDFNPKRTEIEHDRKTARERMRKLRTERKGAAPKVDGSAEQQANVRELFATPTRPDPNKGGALRDPVTPARAQPQGPPDDTCEQHRAMADPPACGRCAVARRARARWDAADAERKRNLPQCRRHRGQPADNCAACRSEALAAPEDT